MNHVEKITQAYSLTPWRRQLQMIGLFLAVLVVGALIAGIYLNVTAKAATVGRQIQQYRLQKEKLEQDIADMQSQLAYLESSVVMEKRALEMGFRPASSAEIRYVVVPGYSGRQRATLASPPQNFVPVTPAVPAAFRQSLFDWIGEKLFFPPAKIGSDLP